MFDKCLLLRVIKGVGRANVGYCPSPGGSVWLGVKVKEGQPPRMCGSTVMFSGPSGVQPVLSQWLEPQGPEAGHSSGVASKN